MAEIKAQDRETHSCSFCRKNNVEGGCLQFLKLHFLQISAPLTGQLESWLKSSTLSTLQGNRPQTACASSYPDFHLSTRIKRFGSAWKKDVNVGAIRYMCTYLILIWIIWVPPQPQGETSVCFGITQITTTTGGVIAWSFQDIMEIQVLEYWSIPCQPVLGASRKSRVKEKERYRLRRDRFLFGLSSFRRHV